VTRLVVLLLAPLVLSACTSEPVPRDAGFPPVAAGVPAPPPATVTIASATAAADAGTPAALRYLALGDSFTAGTGSTPADAFPVRLAERLRVHSVAVTLENLGVNGYTTDDLIARELPRVAPFAPTLVTLAIGANDIVHGSTLERYRAQVRSILAAIVAAGVSPAGVYVLPQPDWSKSPVAADFGDLRALAAQIEAYNEALRAETARVGARWVNLFPRMRKQAEEGLIARDGLHPAAKAYDAWAEELFGQVGRP
jgi:acyl-CoA thioesterase I